MFELNGRYGTAKVFSDLVDGESISQIINMLNQPFAAGQTIRMMPDVHAGAGCTVGTTMTVRDRVCPNLIGTDIGCGMYAVMLEEAELDFQTLDDCIRRHVPSGFSIHQRPVALAQDTQVDELLCVGSCDLSRARRSVGTLGGGNHFIEVNKDSAGCLWLVIHSGSRHLGKGVATFYQDQAVRSLRSRPTDAHVPDALCWCEGGLFDDYVHDMRITQAFAATNRRAMADIILDKMGLSAADEFTTTHNYLDTDAMILRKGAVAASEGQRLIIPMNMRDGSLICVGRGNPDWNSSAPHGAGRLMSRSAAKQSISLAEFEDTMRDVWTTSVGASTLDESPMAYKPMESIVKSIGDTVEIVDVIKPVYNFKAGS